MVNTISEQDSVNLRGLGRLVAAYVTVAVATLALLVVLSIVAPAQATAEAWWHAVIVAGFAVLLAFRTRAVLRGESGAARAVVIIAGVLLVANLVEAALPGVFPVWMRIEMVGIAALMAAVVWRARRAAVER